MDTRSDDADRGDGRFLTIALLVLAGTMGAAFGRLFQDRAPTAGLVAAAAVAVLIGALFRRRHLLLSVGAAVGGLAIAVGLLVFPGTTWMGLPTGRTLDALLRTAGNLGQRAMEQTSPVPALPAFFGPSLIAVWTASYATHALVVRAASPVLGLVPPAGLVGFANVVAEDGGRLGYAGAFLVAALAVLFSAGMLQLRTWGPVLPRRRNPALEAAAGPPGRLARRLGAGAIVIAVAAPGVLPGFGAGPILDLGGSPGDRVEISPLVDIQPKLLSDRALELFTVESEVPAYWRLQGLDEYTGRFWRSSDPSGRTGTLFIGSLTLDDPLGGREGRRVTQRFTLRRLGGTILPVAHRPVDIVTDDLRLLHDADRGGLFATQGIPDGRLEYSVSSLLQAPSAGELDRQFDLSLPDPRYSTLPPDTPPEVLAVAEELTVGARTPFRKALAIQNYLRGFTYDVNVALGHGYEDILEFLRVRRGYCQQFAATMAVLLRALGYPARVAVGFTPGIRDDGLYRVTTQHAHAWTEMFFPGHGWLAFEPTPTRTNPTARYLESPTGIFLSPEAWRFGGADPQPVTGGVRELDPRLQHAERRLGGELPVLEALREEGSDRPTPLWIRLLQLGAAALALLLVVVPLAKWARRRRTLARAGSPREVVLAAYEVLGARAQDLGLHRQPEETPLEYGERLRATVRFSDGHLDRLTALALRAAYAPDEITAPDATAAVRAARALGAHLRRHAGRRRALFAALRPFPPV